MARRYSARILIVVLALGFSGRLPAQGPAAREKVLIRAAKPYTSLVARIESMGGVVTHQVQVRRCRRR